MQGILVLFLPTPVSDALHMFEHNFDEIGNILWEAFLAIRSGETINSEYSLAVKFFKEALNRTNFKKDDLCKTKLLKQILLKMSLRRKFHQHFYSRDPELAIMCFENIPTPKIYIDAPRNLEVSEIATYFLSSDFGISKCPRVENQIILGKGKNQQKV
ncbi:hypothetical protein C1645_816447 [Glomus cerebriforme]|uniref:Uncharacterized protein n=1 Tax=Glomus cerebriforme TaxID=658196 RepID=A0A397TBJ1_9GLOM|nr:hypothetical protein C1645_816447 [Glomus cerebriforme]